MKDSEQIAVFMGSSYVNEPFFDKEKKEMVDFWHWTKPKNGFPIDQTGIELSTCYMIGNFKYDKSWDWLMPVVCEVKFKMEELVAADNLRIHNHEVADPEYRHKLLLLRESFGWAINTFEIEVVYSAIIEFLSWHKNATAKNLQHT